MCAVSPFYVDTKVNASDSLTREHVSIDMTLYTNVWRRVRRFGASFGGRDFTHDLMASDVDAKKLKGLRLPFFSRYTLPTQVESTCSNRT